MNTVFGEKIRQEWRVSGITQKELASKLHMSLRNLQSLFERDDFPISQLMELSKELSKDFVSMYLEEKSYPLSEKKNNVPPPVITSNFPINTNEISIQINIKGDFDAISKHISDVLLSIKQETSKYGLTIA